MQFERFFLWICGAATGAFRSVSAAAAIGAGFPAVVKVTNRPVLIRAVAQTIVKAMRIAALAAGIMIVGGCSYEASERPLPTEADVSRLEDKLTGHPCVGDLSEWERDYRYSMTTGLFTPYSLNPDLDIIEFRLRRAGTVTIHAGRKILPSKRGSWPDSAAVQSVEGRYKIKGGGLTIHGCPSLPHRSG